MYSGLKYLSYTIIDNQKVNNNRVSGGLPHSEIQGSKPILGSPWLIAEYHVLHRLLLPRHPPNALIALDLIQKKTGFFYAAGPFVSSGGLGSKAYFPVPPTGSSEGTCADIPLQGRSLVSVLDLD